MSFLERLQHAPQKLVNTIRWQGNDSVVVLNWATEGIIAKNWGDKLNPYLAEHISKKIIMHRSDVYPFGDKVVHYWIGSHLATACSDSRSIVWGSGFISRDVPVWGVPRDIRAVRGWLSNRRLADLGVKAPNVVGDAALLLPRFFEPSRKYERRSLGIIPHCFEWDVPFFVKSRSWDDCRVIDICGDIEDVVEQIVACDKIVSSSLHGIICADAFGIPAIWLHASNRPKGDGFKFLDYFSSVGRPDQEPYMVRDDTTRKDLDGLFFDYRIQIDLDALLERCPLLPAGTGSERL
jgi:hypothetical protein